MSMPDFGYRTKALWAYLLNKLFPFQLIPQWNNLVGGLK
jgi:hypothetical protein